MNQEKLKPKKILLATGIFPPQIGGPATYSKILSQELPKRGFRAEILNFGSVIGLPKGIRHLVYFFRVLKGCFRNDLIFAQDPVSVGLPSLVAASICGRKFFLKIVGDYAWEQSRQRFGVNDSLDDFLGKKYGWRVEILRKIQKIAAEGACKIIVPSFYLKQVVAKWGIDPEKINVVYNALDEEDAGELPVRNFEGKYLFSAGRLVPWKGFDSLIRVMAKLPAEINLLIAGEGPQRKELAALVNSLGLNGRVRIFGLANKDQMKKLFSEARLFVLNTQYEGLPHVILEAMRQGVPVITTRIGGNPEVIQDGENGILVEYGDQEKLKNAISSLWSDNVLRKKFSDNSLERLKQFSREKMVRGALDVLMS